jgi:transcriptional regulator with GAF, ATPase, and Fis domain
VLADLQILDRHHRAFGEEHRALHDVLELADVARPVVAHQHLLRLGELSTSTQGGESSPVVKIPPTGIALEEIERQALIEALKMSNWVQKDAAELLSISPRVMNYKIKTLAIEYPRGRRMVDVA